MLYSWKNCLSQPGTESSLVSTADVETNGFVTVLRLWSSISRDVVSVETSRSRDGLETY